MEHARRFLFPNFRARGELQTVASMTMRERNVKGEEERDSSQMKRRKEGGREKGRS